MKIYLPRRMDNAELCLPSRAAGFDNLRACVGGRRAGSPWDPVKMRVIRKDEGVDLEQSDAPWCAPDLLVFGERSIAVFEPMLSNSGELLPLECVNADRSLWVYNPVLRDALDVERSVVKRFSTGNIMRIDKYVFVPESVGSVQAFRIPNLRASPTFLEHALVERWRAAELVGLNFELVWP